MKPQWPRGKVSTEYTELLQLYDLEPEGFFISQLALKSFSLDNKDM